MSRENLELVREGVVSDRDQVDEGWPRRRCSGPTKDVTEAAGPGCSRPYMRRQDSARTP
jgi:hypothetical protein